MSLQSLGFWLFLPITALIDLHLPVKWQNPFLAAASLLFYFYNLPSDPARAAVTLAALAGVCVFVYAMALAIGIALGILVAMVRTAHDQQRVGKHNPVLGVLNGV